MSCRNTEMLCRNYTSYYFNAPQGLNMQLNLFTLTEDQSGICVVHEEKWVWHPPFMNFNRLVSNLIDYPYYFNSLKLTGLLLYLFYYLFIVLVFFSQKLHNPSCNPGQYMSTSGWRGVKPECFDFEVFSNFSRIVSKSNCKRTASTDCWWTLCTDTAHCIKERLRHGKKHIAR